MAETEAGAISNEESFENSYRTFIFCLGALAGTPEVACEKYGNYNVAWEIKADVSAGNYLVNNPAHRFTKQQIKDIQALVSVLSALPPEATKFTKVAKESLENMRHPAWEPARKMAALLLETLRPVTESNERYFSR